MFFFVYASIHAVTSPAEAKHIGLLLLWEVYPFTCALLLNPPGTF